MATETVTATTRQIPLSVKNLPPFPTTVPTAPLLQISLAKLLRHDEPEIQRCVRACEELGFFYLDLSSCDTGSSILQCADSLFGVGEELLTLPLEEKRRYDFSGEGSYFGYKEQGVQVIDKDGNLDRNEFYNVRFSP